MVWRISVASSAIFTSKGTRRYVCAKSGGRRCAFPPDFTDFARHVDYVHFNPVKHGLAASAKEWPFSSFRRAVARGDYPADWGDGEVVAGEYGERPEG